ncbi:uncharacterized protein LOC106463508 [Limulus polyphemus]|uniref:Uncharacterized protein LOC106463508 n=1 Tax=Limulus polyphemus TaxID=6850 RepID=A0ABM1BC33_LIMPO|nr:uncharacterized protein LOC106463508 [Limulus polyphemus]
MIIFILRFQVIFAAEDTQEKSDQGRPDKIANDDMEVAENQDYSRPNQYRPLPLPHHPVKSGFGPLLGSLESHSIPFILPLPAQKGSLIFPSLLQKTKQGELGGYSSDHRSPQDGQGGYGSLEATYSSKVKPEESPGYSGHQGFRPDHQTNKFPEFSSLPGSDPWPLTQPEMPKIVHLDVKCEKNLMKISVEFDQPFYGIIFSKGHYNHGNCVHLPAGSGRKNVYFDISVNSCGTKGNTQNGLYGYGGNSGSGTFFENTIIVQYDPQVQEVWDQGRKLRCTWHDHYEKAVTFRPFPVDMLDVVRADFAGDNVGCWMQIQVGKGPWATETAGIVKIGQTMTMVLAIKDAENRFDMLVRNCIAHDGKQVPIKLVDGRGCIVRPKLMSRFTKIKNFGSSASVLSFAHFQAFKFPDSMQVHIQCTIQICRYQCPEQCSYPLDSITVREDIQEPPPSYISAGRPREERDVSYNEDAKIPNHDSSSALEEMTEIGLNKIIHVVSVRDLSFSLTANDSAPIYYTQERKEGSIVCMSTLSFSISLVVLLAIVIISSVLSTVIYLRQRTADGAKFWLPYNPPVLTKNKP